MKSALLAAFAIAAPLALVLLIIIARPASKPARPNPANPTSSPADPTRPARPEPFPPISPGAVPQNPADPGPTPAAQTRRPTTAPAERGAFQARVIDRLEDWLEAWRRPPGQPGSPRDAAAEHLLRGEFEKAAKAFDRLLLENPNDPDLLMGAATALTRLGRHEDALPLLIAILERNPRHAAARYASGITLTRLDRREEAIAAFTRLLETSPDHSGAKFNLAILLQSTGRNQAALTAWRKVTDDLPRSGSGASPLKGGRPPRPPATRPQSETRNRKSALDPTLVTEAWFHHGEAAMAMHQMQEAESCFLEVTRLAPADARAWCNLGIIRATLARWDDAITALNEALRHEPSLVPAINQLSYVYAAKYRDNGRPADRQKVLDLCARSLAIRSDQPNIRALRNALLDAETTQPSAKEHPPASDSE